MPGAGLGFLRLDILTGGSRKMGEDTDGQGASWGAGEALSSGRLLLAFPMKGEVRVSKSEQLGKPVRLLRRVKKG